MDNTLKEAIRQGQGTLLDVRTHEEFMGGNVAGSINIPMSELAMRVDNIEAMEKPIMVFCASGNRSGQAQIFLTKKRVSECFNVGSWTDVNFIKSGN